MYTFNFAKKNEIFAIPESKTDFPYALQFTVVTSDHYVVIKSDNDNIQIISIIPVLEHYAIILSFNL